MKNHINLKNVKFRLKNIQKKATNNVSFQSSEVTINLQEHYISSTLTCLEDPHNNKRLSPSLKLLDSDWNVYGYDESTQNYSSLEGDLFFISSTIIKLANKYQYDLNVMPYFFSSMKKIKNNEEDYIIYSEKITQTRNLTMIKAKINTITNCIEPNSIIFIDGPLVGGNASSYLVEMDKVLRNLNCIPIYFIKNSKSRMIIESSKTLPYEYNSDFHWVSKTCPPAHRKPFYKYQDKYNTNNTKVFTYIKPIYGFPQRVEMHFLTYQKYHSQLEDLFNLIQYFFLVQGTPFNPQVRPIAIAELFAKEGIKILNIPTLLGRLGFHPTINQVRFR